MKKLLFTFCFVFSLSSAFCIRYYVDVNATGSESGTNWTNAFTDLQMALSVSFFGDEIWVASGIYKPTTSTDRSVSFELKDGVNIYGSFAGSETNISERDIALNLTTLSGDIGQLGHTADNSYHVISGGYLSSQIVVDGFRVVSGNSNSRGGGLFIERNLSGELTMKNCYFYNNEAYNYGGAIYLYSAKLNIVDCDFINNESSTGGAIYSGSGNGGGPSILTIEGSLFKNNLANTGACLSNSADYESCVIDRCIFTNNSSNNSILVIDGFNSAKMMNSIMVGNSVDGFSSNLLDVNTFSSDETFELTNCTLAHNFNTYVNTIQDEIINLQESHFEVNNCIIYGNTQYQGTQINTLPIVTNSLIEGGFSGTNVIDSDPLFVNPNSGATNNFDVTSFDYSLMNSSPAINTGENGVVDLINYPYDLNLADRIQGGIVDMGAYESEVVSSAELTENLTSTQQAFYYDYTKKLLRITDEIIVDRNDVRVFDAMGRMVLKERIDNNSVPIELNTGMYFIVIENFPALKVSVQK